MEGSANEHPGAQLVGRRRCAGAGFSFIELLLCVAVMAALGSMALPGFRTSWLRNFFE